MCFMDNKATTISERKVQGDIKMVKPKEKRR